MPDLFITPTRWDLLRAIGEEQVTRLYPILPESPYDRRISDHRVVTAAVAQLDRAGLVFLNEREHGGFYKDPRTWALTADGMASMVAHTCVSCRGYTRTAPTCGTCRGRADDGN